MLSFLPRAILMAAGSDQFGLVGYSNSTLNAQQATVSVAAVPKVRAGDLLVAIMGADGSCTWTGDTGWTETFDNSGSPSIRMATKIATGSEPGSYTFTASSSSFRPAATILAFRRAALDVAGSVVRSGGDFPTAAPAITAAGGILISAFFSYGGSVPTFTTPSGTTPLTPAINNPGSGNRSAVQLFREKIVAGATGTRTSTPTLGGGGTAAFLVGVKKA